MANSIDRGNQQAQFAEIDAQLAIAERKRVRYEQLEGVVSTSAIETARLEVDALKKRRAAVGASIGAPEPLVAPVSGVIGAANVVVGQVVEAKEILFEVIDPARLAVEALAYDAALAAQIGAAEARLPGGRLELEFVGAGRQLREQALPLLFRVKTSTVPLAVGQPLKILAQTSRTLKGVAVPLSAQVKAGAGETAVWVRDGAERFIQRRVKVAPLDAARVAVVDGLADGERVVTAGAGLLAQVR
ncbi:MAG: HlyD family efflux transporter periplasmic adaptor subunit [Burkholderiaceae bacterium]|nr:HlyD family efflux transporter periplasmic adaptor subunit [Burkholderiaceae bacterium]